MPPWLRETRAEPAPGRPRLGDPRPGGREAAAPRAGRGTPAPETSWDAPVLGTEDRTRAYESRAAGFSAGALGDDQQSGHAPSQSQSRPRPMRKSFMVGGILGGAVVLVAALAAVMSLQPPTGSSHAAGFTEATASSAPGTSAPGASAATTKASNTAKASKTAKPSASAKPSKTAKPSPTATPATAAAAPSSLGVPAGWHLAFDPGFSGSLDTSTWATCYSWALAGGGCNDNPNIEKEWYLASQVSESGGTLNLTAKQETTQGTSTSGAAETYSCRSGMVTSRPGFNFTYGLISITAKLPYGPGLWPALWLATTSGQWPPELDIMEHWYSDQDYRIYDHTVGTSYLGGPVPTPVDLSAGFHTFSLLWTKTRVTWYLDGAEKFTTTDDVPQQAMYFIANVADRNPDGDTSPSLVPGACNGTMEISSVKVWQP